MGPNQRWLTIHAKEQPNVDIILQKPDWGADDQTEKERSAQIGKQSGFCFASNNIQDDYTSLKKAGITFWENLPNNLGAYSCSLKIYMATHIS